MEGAKRGYDMMEGYEENYKARLLGETAVDQLTLAAQRGERGVVTAVLASGIAVDARDSTYRSALNWAVSAGQVEIVRLLLAAGADPDQPVGPRKESFPLRWCATMNYLDMADILIRGGAVVEGHPNSEVEISERIRLKLREQNIFPRGEEPRVGSRSPLNTAVHSGFIRMVRLLLDQGIDVEERAIDPGAPLRSAARSHYADIVELLLNHGARVTPLTVKVARMSNSVAAKEDSIPPSEVARDRERTLALLSS